MKFLAGELGIASGKIRVRRGESSRQKTLALQGISFAEVKRKLGPAGGREEKE